MRVYATCPLTLEREERPVLETVKEALEGLGHEVRIAKPLEDPNQIFEIDMDALNHTDLLVAEVSVPSHGVGVEIAASWFLKFPCICMHKKGAKVSRFVRGFPNAKFLEYETTGDIRTKLPGRVEG